MSTEFIPPEHLLHLIGKLPVEQAYKEELERKAISSKPEERAEVLRVIEEAWEGTTARLEESWAYTSRRAFFMWEVLDLGEFDDEEVVRAKMAEAISRTTEKPFDANDLDGSWVVFPRGAKKKERGFAHVKRVRFKNGLLQAQVYIDRPVRVTFEDNPEEDVFRSSVVDVSLDVRSQTPLLKIFAMLTDARRAAMTFLSWLYGKPVPKSRKEQEEWVRALTFTEFFVKQIKQNLNLKIFEVDGEAADGTPMKKRLRGSLEGERPAPLPERHPEVQEMDECALDRRGIYFPFEHPDGFLEQVQVRFYFDNHAHISFLAHTSRPAVEYVVGEVYAAALRADD